MFQHKTLFMKKKLLSFAFCLSAALIWSCNNSGENTSAATDSSANANTTAGTGDSANSATNANNTNSNTTATSNTPLSKDDSMFVMDAAAGGMMEVQAGQVAQQNGQSQRVKDFGGMMVTDHGKANDELKSLASGHGITIPSSLPADQQKHLDQMKNMKGSAFDKHYISMMLTDHQKTIAKFKKESTGAKDDQLKTWATNTLPTLQKHLDSVQAIKKGM
jgi:putative membrane protein